MENVKKERKKLKKGAVIAIVLAVVIVALSGAGLLWYFWDMIFNKPENSDLGSYYGYFGYAPDTEGSDAVYIDYSDRLLSFQVEIETGMAENAADEDKALAAYIIYRVACLADATAGKKAKYSIGTGTATGSLQGQAAGSTPVLVSGSMNLTATYYNLKWPFSPLPSVDSIYNDDTYHSYEVSEEYTQIPAGGVSSSEEALATLGEPFLRMALPFARRSIITPDYKVVCNGEQSSSVITPTAVTANFSDKKSSYSKKTMEEVEAENTFQRQYGETWGDIYGLTARDTSIHIINPDTIIGSSVEISKQTGSGLEGGNVDYYSVKFEVDTETGRGTPESATYYAERLYISQAPQAFLDYLEGYQMYYSELKVEMTVFENGYLRTWGTDETWVMNGSVALVGIQAELSSQNRSTEAFCYDYDTIMQGFSNRYFGNHESVGLPREDLPFYAELQNYSPQEYGTYR